MKTIVALIVTISITFLPLICDAACDGIACDSVKLLKLYVHPSANNGQGAQFIQTDGDETQLNCTPVEDKYLSLHAGGNLFEATYSLLLAALVGDKQVRVRIYENSQDCQVSYVCRDTKSR